MPGTGIKCVGGLIMIFVLKWHSTLTTLFFFRPGPIKYPTPWLHVSCLTNGQCCERAMTLLLVKLSHKNVIYWEFVDQKRRNHSICIARGSNDCKWNVWFRLLYNFSDIMFQYCQWFGNQTKKKTHWLVSNHKPSTGERNKVEEKKASTHTKCSLDLFSVCLAQMLLPVHCHFNIYAFIYEYISFCTANQHKRF